MLTRLLIISILFAVAGCDFINSDVNIDPNQPVSVSPQLLLPQIQSSSARILAGDLNRAQHGFLGLTSYLDDFNMSNGTWNDAWEALYSGPLADVEKMIAMTGESNPHYYSIGLIYKAYFNTILVDLWGDVPVDVSAGTPDDPTPFQPGMVIYQNALADLDLAIQMLERLSPVVVTGDLIFQGKSSAWQKVARSLKLQLLMTTRLVNSNIAADIKAIVDDELISVPGDDFSFVFSKAPGQNHPWFELAYSGDNQFQYIDYQVMFEMLRDKDPRLNFYFKRQTDDYRAVITEYFSSPMEEYYFCGPYGAGTCFKYLADNKQVIEALYGDDPTEEELKYLGGFLGRDRANPRGIPDDGDQRLLPGLYPAGGLFDTERLIFPKDNTDGDNGVFPILTSVDVRFYLLEASLLGYIQLDDAEIFEQAIRTHITQVVEFGGSNIEVESPSADAIDKYVTLWMSKLNVASSAERKLDIVAKQRWFCNWGNAYHGYNLFRRTGYPTELQPPIQLPRQFALRLPYPSSELTLNPHAEAYQQIVYDLDAVFWDTLRFQF